MILQAISSINSNYEFDTILRFVKAGSNITFSTTDMQNEFNTYFIGDKISILHNEIQTLRFKYKKNFCNLLIIGFDNNCKNPFDTFRKLLAKIGTSLNNIKAKNILLDSVNEITFSSEDKIIQQISSILPLSEYTFDKYFTIKSEVIEKNISIITKCTSSLIEGYNISKGVMLARDLVNEISDVLTPEKLAEDCAKYGKEYGFETQTFSKEECKNMDMNLFLSVSKGSTLEPKLIVMRYHNGGNEAPIGLVGKGLTYDSGGLSIKTSGMHLMRYDMNGAAAVIGAMCTIASNKLNKNVIGVVAACENMIDGNSFKNGDIIKSMNGKTVYITNTDAEGRLTLADSITYAIRKEKVSQVIEVAGLTGSVSNFFGNVCAAVLPTDISIFNKLSSLSSITGEKYALLPSFDEYRDMIKSPFADLNNATESKCGGITAGMFIEAFSEGVPFAHIDFGGVPFTSSKSDCQPEGGTGFGVKSLYYYIKNM